MEYLKSVIIFILAGICEIGGGYLVWLWYKESKSILYLLVGGAILILYGIVAALQSSSFGRVYATYGGFFIVMSLLWAWKMDGFEPDRYDIIGSLIALFGVAIIYYAPR
ncbi:YnfA family protein [Leptospira sarikeiensis]|uniref:YnfA family protein n=1 Tax=Leptospira sarikeiensis TaxID=2484943 RepID=A0A4R9K8E4_9LEPT|nr:YnfA family protein [Leptospira sarikeiensis]TGL60965.1 YnfA family protein [Leptospira sarikeiensis]